MEENMVKSEEIEVKQQNGEKSTDPSEKLFTQEQVNEIIRKRLERQKESSLNEEELIRREKELDSREKAFECKKYLSSNGYPSELLEVIDTSDVEKFKEKADKAIMAFETMDKQTHVAPLAMLDTFKDSGAFPDTTHKPKGYWATDSRWRG